MMCHLITEFAGFQELSQISAVPAVHLERAWERTNWEPTTPALYTAQGPEIEWNSDWLWAGLQTTA